MVWDVSDGHVGHWSYIRPERKQEGRAAGRNGSVITYSSVSTASLVRGMRDVTLRSSLAREGMQSGARGSDELERAL
jgi:hypothetical protein